MADVRFIEPGSLLPDLKKRRVSDFQESTRKHFYRQLESLALQQNRRLFIQVGQDDACPFGLAKVRRVLAIDGEEVRLSESHARHRLSPNAPTLAVGIWYEMAIDPASNVILAADLCVPQPERTLALTSTFSIDPQNLPPVCRRDAEAFFSSVRRQPHIPFQFPADGCWARAHETCRLIEEHFDSNPEVVVAKIWNFGDFRVKTDNNPHCAVDWRYHVAPVVKAGTELLVIDPSLFERLATIDEWLDKQSKNLRDFVFTNRDAYDLGEDHTPGQAQLFVEEESEQTEKQLQEFWGGLISQIVCYGPLPYRCDPR